MVFEHTCEEKCLSKRNANVSVCVKCKNKFNLKCFGVNLAPSQLKISIDTNFFFVCSVCHESVKAHLNGFNKTTTNVRKSTNNASITNPCASMGATNGVSCSSTFATTKPFASDILSLKNDSEKHTVLLNEILTHIRKSADFVSEMQQQQLNAVNVNKTNDNHDIVLSQMSKIDDVILTENALNGKVTEILHKISEIHDLRPRKRVSSGALDRYKNALDWNISANHSIANRSTNSLSADTSELFTVIDHFERNSWSSFDALQSVMDENLGKLSDLNNEIHTLRDDVQTIKDKIDSTGIGAQDGPILQTLEEQRVIEILNELDDSKLNKCDREMVLDSNSENGHSIAHSEGLCEFYLAKFSTKTTEKCVLNYMCANGIPNDGKTRVILLMPKNRSLESLSYVTFKIITNRATSELILEDGFWPKPCKISKFTPRRSKIVTLASDNHFL